MMQDRGLKLMRKVIKETTVSSKYDVINHAW